MTSVAVAAINSTDFRTASTDAVSSLVGVEAYRREVLLVTTESTGASGPTAVSEPVVDTEYEP